LAVGAAARPPAGYGGAVRAAAAAVRPGMAAPATPAADGPAAVPAAAVPALCAAARAVAAVRTVARATQPAPGLHSPPRLDPDAGLGARTVALGARAAAGVR